MEQSSFMLFYFGQNTFVFHFCPLQNMLYEMSTVHSIVKFGYFIVLYEHISQVSKSLYLPVSSVQMCHLEHDCIAYWLHIVIYILLEKFWLFLQVLYSLFVEFFKRINQCFIEESTAN